MILSIVIVAYKNGIELINCINSIFSYNDLGDQLEILIVDNSPDRTVELLLNDVKGISYYKNEENGFGRGNNLGFLNSTGKYVFFLNPDTVINDYCFKRMIDLYNRDPLIGMMGFKLIDEERQEHNSYNMRLNYGIAKKVILKTSRYFRLFMPKLMYTCGADILIDRDTFIKIGMFDENIFMYSEEEDIAFRLNRIGKKIAYDSSIVITHLQGKSTGHQDLNNRKRMLDSSKYVCEKHGYSFRREIKKEVRAMKVINGICICLGKPRKYSDEIVNYYKSVSADKEKYV